MSKHLDLEEQEQLAELKHFWNQYGNLISWALIVVFGGIAGWNGWQYWQRTQAVQASAMYDEVERAAQAGDLARLERAFGDVKERFPGTAYAQQAGLLAARVFADNAKADSAQAALGWVASKASDEGYQAVAQLRLAALLVERKSYDEALKLLSTSLPKDFEPLAADRRGDILAIQGKKAEARAEYTKAYQAMGESMDYRRLVEVKLNALGVDAKSLVSAKGAAKS